MKQSFARLAILLVAVSTLFSCSKKDEVYGSISLSQTALFFAEEGVTQSISFASTNLGSLAATSVPDGWKVAINFDARVITVTSPINPAGNGVKIEGGVIDLTGKTSTENMASAYLTVGFADIHEVDPSEQSGCMIFSQPNTIYSFDATIKGENEATLSPSKIALVWQSVNKPVLSAKLVNDRAEVYVTYDSKDIDGDSDKEDLIEGNALIAAYNSAGKVIYSWHIWVSDYSPENDMISLNGNVFMGRNLGALDNNNSSEAEIFASYGTYYQWGRRTPFVGPATYNAASATDGRMMNLTGSVAQYLTYEESTATKGTLEYAEQNPLTYIYGTEDSDFDWLYSDHSTTLWSETKSANDPCPKGWRVPSEDAFANLHIATPHSTAEEAAQLRLAYGWELSDGASSALFMGLGRRNQLNGNIQNINTNDLRPAPWIGCYWSVGATTSGNTSSAMYFSLDTQNEPYSTYDPAKQYARSNGMQIRCQKIE